MDSKELVSAFLSKTLNMDETAVASLYNEDGTVKEESLNQLIEKDVARVKTFKSDTKQFDNGYKKAQGEVLSKLEREFKEKTEFDSELKGVDLFLEYANTKTKSTAEVTDDIVKKHPVYISAIDKMKKDTLIAVEAKEKELTDFKNGISKKETFSKVSSKAFEIFNGLKPILSKDANKAKNQQDDFIEKLKGYEYEIQGDRIVILKDGKALEDAHGHAINFDTIVKATAEKYYDFHVTDPHRSSTGNGLDKDGKPIVKKIDVKVPQNDKEYMAALTDPKLSLEERVAVKEAYTKSKEPATV